IPRPTFGAPVAGLPCGMSEQPGPGSDPADNPTLVYRLMLLVPPDDPLKAGDRVTMVADAASGQVVDSGPTYVSWVRSIQAWGPIILHQAALVRVEGESSG
ncbi:MAG TPA: hypothetical protein VFQ46_01770, partial [Candidatus Limnocylindria bacterium]|nr:hypothetical protein [Candidatus Limnocylindria bacterium]